MKRIISPFLDFTRKGQIKMRLIYAEYNPLTNSIDVTIFENYILRIGGNKAKDGLKTTPCSQNSHTLARWTLRICGTCFRRRDAGMGGCD